MVILKEGFIVCFSAELLRHQQLQWLVPVPMGTGTTWPQHSASVVLPWRHRDLSKQQPACAGQCHPSACLHSCTSGVLFGSGDGMARSKSVNKLQPPVWFVVRSGVIYAVFSCSFEHTFQWWVPPLRAVHSVFLFSWLHAGMGEGEAGAKRQCEENRERLNFSLKHPSCCPNWVHLTLWCHSSLFCCLPFHFSSFCLAEWVQRQCWMRSLWD